MSKSRFPFGAKWRALAAALLVVFPVSLILSQPRQEEFEPIDSDTCEMCHETSQHETVISEDVSHSIHDGFSCQDCHLDKGTTPHQIDPAFEATCQGCTVCHVDQGEQYTIHGRDTIEDCEGAPTCADCHGDHDILPSTVKNSRTHPARLPETCGRCHEDLNLTAKYEILIDHPIEIYQNSVHGEAARGGIFGAATCNDCHSSGGSAHKIYSPGHPESTINHFNIPATCGKCHQGIETEYRAGIHGQLAERSETDSPVCTNCHGEHGIIAHSDPRSPVSPVRLAEATCSPCHESAALSEKYGLPTGRLASFIDSYHGLKSKAGDQFVANCASCHGVHRILPSTNPSSTVHPDNLQATCGGCHPGISAELAATPIHGEGQVGLQTRAAGVVRTIYIAAIIIIIGLMALHWLIDLFRQIVLVARKSRVRRMRLGELWQHHLLMVSFIVLVITGFSLRYHDSWLTRLFFGWEHGFELRGIIHRVAAVVLSITTVWHIFYLMTRRGRTFLKDMFPKFHDFLDFGQKILFNLGLSKREPRFKRFSYIEKAEYWALIWGNGVMILTGILLWFDNTFVRIFPKGVLDVALVIHFYEAILASLAILIWHLYATVFNPQVYPMNPAWLTGRMPEEMYKHEHPAVPEEDIERV